MISSDRARDILLLHECAICDEEEEGKSYCTIIFPAGTTRTELWPRAMEARFRVVLPDGLELREVDSRQERTRLFLVL